MNLPIHNFTVAFDQFGRTMPHFLFQMVALLPEQILRLPECCDMHIQWAKQKQVQNG